MFVDVQAAETVGRVYVQNWGRKLWIVWFKSVVSLCKTEMFCRISGRGSEGNEVEYFRREYCWFVRTGCILMAVH